jgi:hypothetical protein
MLLGDLDKLIRAVCPIYGITSEGTIVFKPEATGLEKSDAQNIMDAHIGDLDSQIDAMWALIKARRDSRKAGGAKVGDKWFHTDDSSKTQHLGNKDTARDQLEAGGSMADPLRDPETLEIIRWKTMDGSFVAMTVQLSFDIVKAVKKLEFSTFAMAEIHRAAMQASEAPEDYDFSGGWPLIYGE